MTSSHVFFIPAMLLVGAIFGYVMGRRMLLAEQEEARRAAARRARIDAALHAGDEASEASDASEASETSEAAAETGAARPSPD